MNVLWTLTNGRTQIAANNIKYLFNLCSQLNRQGMKVLSTKKNQQCFKSCFRLAKNLSLVLCFALFILLTVEVLEKFFKGMTDVGIILKGYPNKTKALPCVTLCPWSGNEIRIALLCKILLVVFKFHTKAAGGLANIMTQIF